MTNKTVIGFDYGTKKTGIAIGQTLLATAQPLTTINTIKNLPETRLLDKIIQEWQPHLAVIGLPASANEEFTKKVKKFQQLLLNSYALKSTLIDETLTTEQANFELYESGIKMHKKGASRDQIAARLILETYFGTLTNNTF